MDQGYVNPIIAKVESIINYPVPTDKKQLMKFLGIVGFYKKFCKIFSTVVSPLTDLKNNKYLFGGEVSSDEAFKRIKFLLISKPILSSPDFTKPFKLVVDGSDVGAGVLLQDDDEGTEKTHLLLIIFQKS